MQDLLMAALTEPVTRLEVCAPNTQRERPRDSGGTRSQQPEQPQRHKGRFVLVINSFIGPRESGNPFAEFFLVMEPGRA